MSSVKEMLHSICMYRGWETRYIHGSRIKVLRL